MSMYQCSSLSISIVYVLKYNSINQSISIGYRVTVFPPCALCLILRTSHHTHHTHAHTLAWTGITSITYLPCGVPRPPSLAHLIRGQRWVAPTPLRPTPPPCTWNSFYISNINRFIFEINGFSKRQVCQCCVDGIGSVHICSPYKPFNAVCNQLTYMSTARFSQRRFSRILSSAI